MDENMLDIDNDDLLGDSLDSDAEQIEAISQLSPVNTVRSTKAPLPEQPAHTENATKPGLDAGAKKQADPYVPKGLLKKKVLSSPDIKGANASKKLQALDNRASPKKKIAPGKNNTAS
ncbi:Uncharacterized protein Rs2_28998 [Raphanus sativus]|nr:Uncharacterized protein Rs2_28998 [Raphanus sativus]